MGRIFCVAGEFWAPFSAISSKNSAVASHRSISVGLIVPMQRSRKSLLVSGKKALRGPGGAFTRAGASSGFPATPEALSLTEASRAGVRHLPRFAAAAAAPADDGGNKDRGGEMQPLLSPLLVLWLQRMCAIGRRL
jgi:hypothetical protein